MEHKTTLYNTRDGSYWICTCGERGELVPGFPSLREAEEQALEHVRHNSES